jgi:hypothetical protein
MTLKPDFQLEVRPQTWLMTADDHQSGVITVGAIEGFSDMVTLAIDGLPTGVSATLEPNPVPAGTRATVRLTTAGALLGDYEVRIRGSATASEHEQRFTLAVVDQVYDTVLPVIAR